MEFSFKNKFIILFFILFIQGCSSQNTTDPQVSKNIKESKLNGFFIKQYNCLSTTDKNIIVEEAWFEYVWFYEYNSIGSFKKVKSKWCQLCFKLKQTPLLRYKQSNFTEWKMKFVDSKNYPGNPNVGISYGIYCLEFNSYNAPETIVLDLISRKDEKSEIKDTKVGSLIFKSIKL